MRLRMVLCDFRLSSALARAALRCSPLGGVIFQVGEIVHIVNIFLDDRSDMSTAGSALFQMARAPNACMQDRPRKSVGGDMEILSEGSHRLQLHPKRTEVGSTHRD